MRSDTVKKGFERAPHRSLLKAAGVTDAHMGKPFIAVCNSFVEIVPGHVHLNRVGRYVKECVREAGGVAFEFNTIGVDDGIARGHRGDWIRLDIPARKLELVISEAELAERRAKWQLPPKEKPDGCLGKYAAMANSASTGAVLKW